MTMNIVELGRWIARERREQGLDQAELGTLIGKEYSLISDIERARRKDVGYTTLRRILAALGYELHFEVRKMP